MVTLEIVIMLVRLGTIPHFLQLEAVLPFLGRLILFRLLVLEFAKIKDATDGRTTVGGNLNQIQFIFVGPVESLFYRHNTKLLAFGTDEPDRSYPNPLIDP